MTVYAHTKPGRPKSEWELLSDHAEHVAVLTEHMCERFAPKYGRALGLLHDAGKYQPDFQAYLSQDPEAYDESSGKPGSVPHSVVGAALAREASKTVWPLIAWPIAAHHGELKGPNSLKAKLDSAKSRVDAAKQGGMPWDLLRASIPADIPRWATDGVASSLGIRVLFSALVDADMLATEQWDKGHSRLASRESIASLAEALETYLQNKRSQDAIKIGRAAELAAMRASVSDACLSSASASPGRFRLTVPTGGGKTLSGLRFALRHALVHGLSRVVVVIPYTSILEQTVRVYRGIFDTVAPDAVIEHHSSLDPEGESLRNRQACENWDAPIIVTTSVQFFETLYANHKRPCRKLHRIANSVILLDEVQTFPLGLLRPILSALDNLTKHFGASVVSMTATQPLLAEERAEREIVPEPRRLYAVVRDRFRLEWLGTPDVAVEWQTVADHAMQHQRVLVIVHSRRDAEQLARMLGADCWHLSARMCAAHRLDVLARIRKELEGHGPCRVVATQLVEAGVDIDFPVVFRAFAGLETLAQAAGRCNREFSPEPGRFIVFRASSEPPTGTLRAGLNTAFRFWEQGNFDLNDPDIFPRYMGEVLGTECPDQKDILTYEREMDFPEVARRFRMIDQAGATVVVPYGEGWKRVKELESGPLREGLRRIQRYTVTLYEQEFRRLRREGYLEPLFAQGLEDGVKFNEVTWVNPGDLQPPIYSERFGLSWQGVEEEPPTLIA